MPECVPANGRFDGVIVLPAICYREAEAFVKRQIPARSKFLLPEYINSNTKTALETQRRPA